jgi:uncharacterized peroxidase-related enzyme
MAELFNASQAKRGFVPNLLQTFGFDTARPEACVAYGNDLIQGQSGLSRLEREMIATVVAAQNRCCYCLATHGAAVRSFRGIRSRAR